MHEIKHDGHRVIAYLERGRVRLETRAGNDATRRFAPVAEPVARLPVRSAILDGEIAVPDERGVTHIALLDQALRGRGGPLAFYLFDLLHRDGWDLRRCPLLDRKAALDRAPEACARADPASAIISPATARPCSPRSASSAAKASSPSGSMRLTPPAPPRPG